MSLTVLNVTDLRYGDAENTTVEMVVTFREFPNPLPFFATPFDPEFHGRDLCRRAIAGEFGKIEPFIPPPPPAPPQLPPRQNLLRRVIQAVRG